MTASELPIEASDAILTRRIRWEHKRSVRPRPRGPGEAQHLTIANRDEKILNPHAALTPTLKD